MTGGSDAFGDVVVQLEIDGRRVTGRGVATDVVEASARAYLAAVNRALQVTRRRAPRTRRRRDGAQLPDRRDPRATAPGPRSSREGLKVLDAVRDGFATELVEFDLGADRYLRTGEVLPDDELERLRELDAIFLGAVGDPRVKPGILERDLLLKVRFGLDQYVNLRPVVRYPGVETLVPSHTEDDVNLVVVRENSEGLYIGRRRLPPQGHRARGGGAGVDQHPARGRADRPLRVRLGDAAAPSQEAHARAQDERADVRGRPVPAGGRRGGRGVPGGARPTTCTSTRRASTSWTGRRGST